MQLCALNLSASILNVQTAPVAIPFRVVCVVRVFRGCICFVPFVFASEGISFAGTEKAVCAQVVQIFFGKNADGFGPVSFQIGQ